jgi:anti-anti-sigma factor
MILDLSRLTYISSAGISALMGLTRRMREQDGELYLLKPTDKVYRVFRTLGFTNIFRIINDEAEMKSNARQA